MKPTPIYITPKLYETAKVRRRLIVEGVNPTVDHVIAECDAIIESWEGAQKENAERVFAEGLKACDKLDAIVNEGGKEGLADMVKEYVARATKELAEALKAANDKLNLQAAAAGLIIADLKEQLAKAKAKVVTTNKPSSNIGYFGARGSSEAIEAARNGEWYYTYEEANSKKNQGERVYYINLGAEPCFAQLARPFMREESEDD
jgi:hypothetical protein